MEIPNARFDSRVGLDKWPHPELVDVLEALHEIAIRGNGALRMNSYVMTISCVALCTLRSHISESLSVVIKLCWAWILAVPRCGAIQRALAFALDACNSRVEDVAAHLN